MPGVERTNWMDRWASVVSPGRSAASSAGSFCVSWPCITEAEAIT